eukprot:GFYU01001881.1.p1 GENE.GFYU01001881.1~~GFYU01001881.1.p1  ORF type:complete len:693 (-),score=176.53 GFYU01001881.1:81-2159(-)
MATALRKRSSAALQAAEGGEKQGSSAQPAPSRSSSTKVLLGLVAGVAAVGTVAYLGQDSAAARSLIGYGCGPGNDCDHYALPGSCHMCCPTSCQTPDGMGCTTCVAPAPAPSTCPHHSTGAPGFACCDGTVMCQDDSGLTCIPCGTSFQGSGNTCTHYDSQNYPGNDYACCDWDSNECQNADGSQCVSCGQNQAPSGNTGCPHYNQVDYPSTTGYACCGTGQCQTMDGTSCISCDSPPVIGTSVCKHYLWRTVPAFSGETYMCCDEANNMCQDPTGTSCVSCTIADPPQMVCTHESNPNPLDKNYACCDRMLDMCQSADGLSCERCDETDVVNHGDMKCAHHHPDCPGTQWKCCLDGTCQSADGMTCETCLPNYNQNSQKCRHYSQPEITPPNLWDSMCCDGSTHRLDGFGNPAPALCQNVAGDGCVPCDNGAPAGPTGPLGPTGPTGGNNNVAAPSFDFGDGFCALIGQSDAISLVGDAVFVNDPSDNCPIRVTESKNSRNGAAWKTVSFGNDYSFESYMVSKMYDGSSTPADGMTFTIHQQGTSFLGSAGGCIGACNIPGAITVEFDSWKNGWDCEAKHVAINDHSTTGHWNNVRYIAKETRGVKHTWVNYDGTTLRVYHSNSATKPPCPTLEYPVDLAAAYPGSSDFVMGYTASTGGARDVHEVRAWTFNQPYVHTPAGACPDANIKTC